MNMQPSKWDVKTWVIGILLMIASAGIGSFVDNTVTESKYTRSLKEHTDLPMHPVGEERFNNIREDLEEIKLSLREINTKLDNQ